MRTAVLVDAAFFLKRYKRVVTGGRDHTGQQVAEALHRFACDHSSYDQVGGRGSAPGELYRLFVYDCRPFAGKLHHPLTKTLVDYSKTDLFKFRQAFLARLPQLRKVALRLGHLSEVRSWRMKDDVLVDLIKGKRDVHTLTEGDVVLDVKQKGVDMRIGVDVASLAYKRQVDRIVLIAGDADFVPAAKLARREGIDFVLDSMHAHINDALYEHIDGLVSMVPAQDGATVQGQPPKGYDMIRYSVPIGGGKPQPWPVQQPARARQSFFGSPAEPASGIQGTPTAPPTDQKD